MNLTINPGYLTYKPDTNSRAFKVQIMIVAPQTIDVNLRFERACHSSWRRWRRQDSSWTSIQSPKSTAATSTRNNGPRTTCSTRASTPSASTRTWLESSDRVESANKHPRMTGEQITRASRDLLRHLQRNPRREDKRHFLGRRTENALIKAIPWWYLRVFTVQRVQPSTRPRPKLPPLVKHLACSVLTRQA